MNYSGKVSTVLKAFFFILAPFFFISLTISLLAFNHDFFFSLQKGIGYPATEETYELDRKIASSLFYGVKGVNLEEFTQKEVLHLKDIHRLLRLVLWFSIYSGVLIIGLTIFLALKEKNFRRTLVWGFLTSTGFYLTLGLFFFLFFDWAFLNFHLAVFSNDYWILGEDYLLFRLFPPELFQKALLPFFLILVFLTSLFYLLASAISKKPSKASSAS